MARALGEWIQNRENFPPEVSFNGSALLSERAIYTGFCRQGSTTVGGAGRLLPLLDGSLAAVSCARVDDPLLYSAALGTPVMPTDPWPALTLGMSQATSSDVQRMALELSLPCWPVDQSEPPASLPRQAIWPTRQPRDFAGLRVIDFSSLWAGPLCAHILGLLGAEVIKVESTERPDGARYGNKKFYSLLHSGHKAVSFTPSDPSSLAALHDLVASADIIIEASRPRALMRLGIDAEAHIATGATWVSITAAGRTSSRIGFGDDVAASAGLIARDHDGSPCFVGDAIADPLAGLFAAASCMTVPGNTVSAMEETTKGSAEGSDQGTNNRRRRGELWDISMYNIVRHTLWGFDAADRLSPSPGLETATPPTARVLPQYSAPHALGEDNARFLSSPHLNRRVGTDLKRSQC
ncbi:hypothetical protein JOF28_002539 [Leucobacter exalbidus]|uniref:CoA transferase n=1 Tax=Leucobacter exalbidus TaxID=662960 RepID=A0A940PNN0_9MICO|nr:hypothetical protein [Leucobacter exalbidus]